MLEKVKINRHWQKTPLSPGKRQSFKPQPKTNITLSSLYWPIYFKNMQDLISLYFYSDTPSESQSDSFQEWATQQL